MTNSQKVIAYKIQAKYGYDSQIEMAIEEMAELTLALQKLKRGHKNPSRTLEYRNQVINEIADVKIMIQQLEFIFDENLVAEQVRHKLNRQVDRMNLEL